VIVGNPPYSVGQKSQNDNNANVSYDELDKRIVATYAAKSRATSKKSLRDSYIRAIRWASDRIDKDTGGIVGFVANAGWLDSAASDGLRKCLIEEFSSLYIFHLRGDIRSEIRSNVKNKTEGGNVFGQGSTTGVAISILVKQPGHDGHGEIHFCDIGDYLNREQKLQKISELVSIAGIEKQALWQFIEPDAHGDWLNQRQGDFEALLPMGDAKNKNKPNNTGIFQNYSLGINTNRDAWCNNPSRVTLLQNVKCLADFYEQQRAAFKKFHPDAAIKQRQEKIAGFVNTDPTKISWSSSLLADFARDKELIFNPQAAVSTLYRPFSKGWLYYDGMLNHRVGQMPHIFPLPAATQEPAQDGNLSTEQGTLFASPKTSLLDTKAQAGKSENRIIAVSTIGAKTFSALMSDCIMDLHVLESGTQCFPRYLYDETGKQKDGITDVTLKKFQTHYQNKAISKDQLFHYVYGVLHSPDYREKYAHNLTKELPRIPFAASFDDFSAFAEAGEELGNLHVNFETAEPYDGVTIDIHKTNCTTLNDLQPEDFTVEKMKHGKTAAGKDITTIIYNRHITLRNIPEKAYEYVVNGRCAIDWVMERQCIKTDKASGIVSDANRYASETLNNPRYPLELLLCVITVSLETLKIVQSLPDLSGQC